MLFQFPRLSLIFVQLNIASTSKTLLEVVYFHGNCIEGGGCREVDLVPVGAEVRLGVSGLNRQP